MRRGQRCLLRDIASCPPCLPLDLLPYSSMRARRTSALPPPSPPRLPPPPTPALNGAPPPHACRRLTPPLSSTLRHGGADYRGRGRLPPTTRKTPRVEVLTAGLTPHHHRWTGRPRGGDRRLHPQSLLASRAEQRRRCTDDQLCTDALSYTEAAGAATRRRYSLVMQTRLPFSVLSHR